MTAHEIHGFPTGSIGEGIGVREVTITPAPAAGADWTYTAPAGYYRRLITGMGTLVCSNQAATRACVLSTMVEGVTVFTAGPAVTATANQSLRVSPIGVTVGQSGSTPALTTALAVAPTFLPPGSQLVMTTQNIQTNDQWSSVALWWECWDYSPGGQQLRMHYPTLMELEEIVTIEGVPHARLAKPEHRGGGK